MSEMSWQEWTKHNLERGCEPIELHVILSKNGFSEAEIRAWMGAKYPERANVGDVSRLAPVDHIRLTKVALTKNKDKRITRIKTDKLQLYTIDQFLTVEECDALLEVIATDLRPSTIVGETNDKYYRTSSTCDLARTGHGIVETIDEKISSLLGIHEAFGEEVQAQRYEVGQQFKAHTDYFDPGTQLYIDTCSILGNRTWTFMVYLNDTPKGGGTEFTRIGKTFYPKKGTAVAWNNLKEDGSVNMDTMHSGMPVEEGNKIIITKWFRERCAVPMFLD